MHAVRWVTKIICDASLHLTSRQESVEGKHGVLFMLCDLALNMIHLVTWLLMAISRQKLSGQVLTLLFYIWNSKKIYHFGNLLSHNVYDIILYASLATKLLTIQSHCCNIHKHAKTLLVNRKSISKVTWAHLRTFDSYCHNLFLYILILKLARNHAHRMFDTNVYKTNSTIFNNQIILSKFANFRQHSGFLSSTRTPKTST